MHIFLDVSRLLLCVLRPSPAGIDRVELAYARRWAGQPEACSFVAWNAWGGLALVPHGRIQALLGLIGLHWAAGPQAPSAWHQARLAVAGIHGRLLAGAGRAALRRRARQTDGGVYLLVSHLSLEAPARIAAARRLGLAFVPMLHDLIPTTHPEYARPVQVARHARRLATTAHMADGVLVNSAATAAELRAHWPAGAALLPIMVARLGLDPQPLSAPPPAEPYFVTLGTIEPRKNHLLLLNLWRDLAARLGPAAPKLYVIGRRGWENENVLDMLERCTALAGLVQETGPLPDPEVARLLSGARALLFPSFAEGYGLPLAEALALGTPALCSDLPALREVGGAVPEFLDPLDGMGWRQAVLDYAAAESPRRAAQLARLAGWQAPDWASHFQAVDRLLAQITPPRATPAVPQR